MERKSDSLAGGLQKLDTQLETLNPTRLQLLIIQPMTVYGFENAALQRQHRSRLAPVQRKRSSVHTPLQHIDHRQSKSIIKHV